uniref:Uncharacterized protein n=1 Tax=viral metagenome TaxID=1070528 RepID=A0A6C0DHX9_9ZZZZ
MTTTSNYSVDNYIGPDELIYNKSPENGIYSGGFSIRSIMMQNNMSPIITLNGTNGQNGGKIQNVSDLFDNLVVPNWAIAYNYTKGGGVTKDDVNDDDEFVEEELHEKLLSLVKVHDDELREKNTSKNKKKTRKPYLAQSSNKKSKKRLHK